MVAGFLDHRLQALHVETHHLPAIFAHTAADDDGVDVAAFGRLHHSADRVVRRVEVDVVGANHDDIGLFAGRQRADFVVEAGAAGAAHGGAVEHVSSHQ